LLESFHWEFPDSYNMGWDVCDKWADEDPTRTAVIDLTLPKRKDVSFGELKVLSNRLANHLVSIGITPGDRVGVFRSQSVWTAAAHIAIWKLGGISIPLFTLFGEEALEMRLKDSGAKAIITDKVHSEKFADSFERLPELKHDIIPEDGSLESQSDAFEIAKTMPETPGLIIYTSGTTGAPKGALHGHRVLRGHVPGISMLHNILPHEDDVFWTPADWAWIGGLMNVLMVGLYFGLPVVASRMAKFNVAECQQTIDMGKVRNVFFPPTVLRMLKAEGAKITGLRSIFCGGEPLGVEMLEWGKEALGLTVNEGYGQTECNAVLANCSTLFEPQPGCAGKSAPGHHVEVIDDDCNPASGEGDIAVKRGTAVMMVEYWNNPEATKAKFRTASNGTEWLLTGDRGIREGDFIRFIGRDDDVITSAGYRIGPGEIEDCLLKHEAVASVGVVGKPDTERTEIVKAYVLLKGCSKPCASLGEDLKTFVKKRLSAHEYPREIEFVQSLPMTVTGKIIRKELKARAVKEAESA
ncbi:MAG: AMP-binding protein, partial [Pseudomonadota bacterium]